MDYIVCGAAVFEDKWDRDQKRPSETLRGRGLKPVRGSCTHVKGHACRGEVLTLPGRDLKIKLAQRSSGGVSAECHRKRVQRRAGHVAAQELRCRARNRQGKSGR